KSASTPIDAEKPLLKDLDGEDVDVYTYRYRGDKAGYVCQRIPMTTKCLVVAWLNMGTETVKIVVNMRVLIMKKSVVPKDGSLDISTKLVCGPGIVVPYGPVQSARFHLTTSTPMETSKPLMKDENVEDVDVYLYRSMIGSLMYLTSSMHDIMFVVCACARFQVTTKVSHLYAVKKIFRYLKGQPKLGLWYPKDSPFELEAYTDSDYAGTSLDRKSTIGADPRRGDLMHEGRVFF
nr:uncharacterized mitochondrial protein AtMg00810-like [Tanacetum cinerariifolium]